MSRVLSKEQQEAVIGFMSKNQTILAGPRLSGKSYIANIIAAEMYIHCMSGKNMLITASSAAELDEIKSEFEVIFGEKFVCKNGFGYHEVNSKSTKDTKFYFMIADRQNIRELKGIEFDLYYCSESERSDYSFVSYALSRLTKDGKSIVVGLTPNFNLGSDVSRTVHFKHDSLYDIIKRPNR